MIDIKKAIYMRAQYGILPSPEYMDAILGDKPKKAGPDRKKWKKKENTKSIALITYSLSEARIKGWNVSGVYGLGKVYANLPMDCYVVILTKIKPNSTQFAIWKGAPFDERYALPMELHKGNNELILPEMYTKDWQDYISLLENWINTGKVPDGGEQYEWHVIDTLYKNSIHPYTYSQEAIDTRQALAKRDIVALSEIAYIYKPKLNKASKERVKVLNPGDWEEPLDIGRLKREAATDVVLQPGDLFFDAFSATFDDNDSKPDWHIFRYDGAEPIYASVYLIVLRCENVPPEYLAIYLTSNTAIKVWNSEFAEKQILALTEKDLHDLPVPIPLLEDEQYKREYEILRNTRFRDYDCYQRVLNYYDSLLLESESSDIENILNLEIIEEIKIKWERRLYDLIRSDMEELNKCFASGAYKATLIMAGSILEAVLIDWLSEIHHIDYFKRDFRVIGNPETGEERNANLKDYIEEIDHLKMPSWIDGANAAHAIREKRNLVHAKLCLSEEAGINEEMCKKVVKYLGYVIETRNTLK